MPTQPADVIPILATIASIEAWEELWWRTDEEYAPITLLIKCNDLFHPATADDEEITIDNLKVLKQAIADVQEVDSDYGDIYATTLFACRVRGMRPQGPAYPKCKGRALWHLFDACGPERPRAGERPSEDEGKP